MYIPNLNFLGSDISTGMPPHPLTVIANGSSEHPDGLELEIDILS